MQEEMISIFLEESHEHLQALNTNLLALEKDPTSVGLVGDIFRSAHTFKGMAATMEFHQMAQLTHTMENVLDEVRHGNLVVTTEIIDIIFECTEILETMVSDVQQGGVGDCEAGHIILQLEAVLNGDSIVASEPENTMHKVKITLATDIPLKSVRAIMCVEQVKEYGDIVETVPPLEKIEAEEFDNEFTLIFSLKEEQFKDELQKTIANITDVEHVQFLPTEKNTSASVPVPASEKEPTPLPKTNGSQNAAAIRSESKSIRVQLEKIDQLMNVFEESVVERGKIEEIAQHLKQKELMEHLVSLGDVSKEIQNLLLSMRMVPIETIFNRYPKMVRTLAKDLGKKINLIITGEDTEVDKIVIDEIGDPLVHLIRNAVDHGIETVEERKAAGKPEAGTVRLEAFHSGNNVVIQVSEDGRGINKESVINKAIKNNIISEYEAKKLLDYEVYDLIFQPGFSTAEVISDVSGRGVGLDVVKTIITKLGGTLSVTSELGKGSVFSIEIPLTLSIIQAMLVGTSKSRYVVPLGNVVEAMQIERSKIQVINGKSVINYRDQIIETIAIEELFDETKEVNRTSTVAVLIIKNAKRTYAIVIDRIIGQREIVLKSLGEFFANGTVYFTGATILGDGRVVLVLNPDAF